MYTLLSVLIVIACILLMLVVLIQNPKGGGLAANFQSTNMLMGVKKTAEFVEKATWGLAIAIMVFALSTSFFVPKADAAAGEQVKSKIQDKIDNAAMPATPIPPQGNPEEQAPQPNQ